MPIEKITADDLRDMEHQEGLVLQGCGGEAQEWLDGINDLLTQDGILQNGNRFETVKVFQHDGLTNLLFPFEDIQVDMGKLAMWRLQTHGAFGGTWLLLTNSFVMAVGNLPVTLTLALVWALAGVGCFYLSGVFFVWVGLAIFASSYFVDMVFKKYTGELAEEEAAWKQKQEERRQRRKLQKNKML